MRLMLTANGGNIFFSRSLRAIALLSHSSYLAVAHSPLEMTMLILYIRLLDQSQPSFPKKNSVNPQNNIQKKNLSREAHNDATQHLNQVKTNYSLHRRFII